MPIAPRDVSLQDLVLYLPLTLPTTFHSLFSLSLSFLLARSLSCSLSRSISCRNKCPISHIDNIQAVVFAYSFDALYRRLDSIMGMSCQHTPIFKLNFFIEVSQCFHFQQPWHVSFIPDLEPPRKHYVRVAASASGGVREKRGLAHHLLPLALSVVPPLLNFTDTSCTAATQKLCDIQSSPSSLVAVLFLMTSIALFAQSSQCPPPRSVSLSVCLPAKG